MLNPSWGSLPKLQFPMAKENIQDRSGKRKKQELRKEEGDRGGGQESCHTESLGQNL